MPEKTSRPRRTVSNEEVILAYYGGDDDEQASRSAADNRNIIKSVLRKYRDVLSKDELESCGLSAIWRTLQYHRDEYGQKFTTSLYRFTHWECQREARRLYGRMAKYNCTISPLEKSHIKMCVVSRDANNEDLEHIRECIELLPREWMRQVINQYFFEDMTLEAIGRANGYSKETARKRVKKAVSLLKNICHAGVLAA